MNITDVKVFPVDEDKLKAYATITIDNCFIVRDLKVIAGTKGFFIAMPSKKRKDGTFRDIAHPLNAETRSMIEQSVLDVFNAERPAGTPAAILEAYEALAESEASVARSPAEKRTERAVQESARTSEPRTRAETPTSESQPATGIPDIKTPDDPAKAFGYEEK